MQFYLPFPRNRQCPVAKRCGAAASSTGYSPRGFGSHSIQMAHTLKPVPPKKRGDSGILVLVRRTLILCTLLFMAAAAPPVPANAQTAQTPAPTPPEQTPAPIPSQAPAPPPTHTLAVVVLDPAHGGADQGARGSSGISESDVVLSFARLLRISLEAQGLRVILTRAANEDPSFDDRSKTANAQRAAIFITLHVSSTGQPGTVRVYSELPGNLSAAPRAGLIPWDRAQAGSLDLSRRLAELIQIQMAQRFHGSPETPLLAPVRQLRTVAAPAVAIEISSVSLTDRGPLDQMGPALADSVARAVAAFRIIYESGGK
jgi:N-acetylmuramoyl-L-alanine amidase